MKQVYYLLIPLLLILCVACGRSNMSSNEGVMNSTREKPNSTFEDRKYKVKYLLGAEEEMSEENLIATVRILKKRMKQSGFYDSEYRVKAVNNDIELQLRTDEMVDKEFMEYLISSRCELQMNEVYSLEEINPLLGQADTALQRKEGLPIAYSGKGFEETDVTKHPLLGKVGKEAHYPTAIAIGSKKDLESIADLLNSENEEWKGIFPSDCRFVVSKKSLTYGAKDLGNSYTLYATKINPQIDWNDGIAETKVSYGMQGDEVIDVVMDADLARHWAKITADNIDKPLAIIIDNEVYSAPIVRAAITGGRTQISGNFTKTELRGLVGGMRGGCLPVELEVKEVRAIGD